MAGSHAILTGDRTPLLTSDHLVNAGLSSASDGKGSTFFYRGLSVPSIDHNGNGSISNTMLRVYGNAPLYEIYSYLVNGGTGNAYSGVWMFLNGVWGNFGWTNLQIIANANGASWNLPRSSANVTISAGATTQFVWPGNSFIFANTTTSNAYTLKFT